MNTTIKSPVMNYARLMMIIAVFLSFVGIVFVYSSSSIYALEKIGRADYFLRRQCLFMILGMIGFGAALRIPLALYRHYSSLFYIGVIAFTAVTLGAQHGMMINGAARWIKMGTLSLQPSELLAIAVLLFVAAHLAKERVSGNVFTRYFSVALAVPFIVLLFQPDFGSAVTIASTVFLVIAIMSWQPVYALVAAGIGIPLIGLLVIIAPYRVNRIMTFLNPWNDPQGKGFQIIQSLIAIGSGGWWGRGLSFSNQKFFYLPMSHTDFIFSITAEEMGFVFSAFLVVLFFAFVALGLRMCFYVQDTFARALGLGCIIFIGLRSIINLMVTVGLLPTKGIGLPFISYGGSALVCHLFMLGIILNVARTSARS